MNNKNVNSVKKSSDQQQTPLDFEELSFGRTRYTPKADDYLHYIDGCNNEYYIEVQAASAHNSSPKINFHYRGITEMESSSGSYSGGPPVDKEHCMSFEVFQSIFCNKLLSNLIAEHGKKTIDRTMGTGQLCRVPNSCTKLLGNVVLPLNIARTESKSKFEEFLGALKN